MPLEDYKVISCDIKKRLPIPIRYEKTSYYPCYHFCSFLPRGKNLIRYRISIPFRYNRRSCHCLPVSVKRDIQIPLIASKPVQQCLSEAIFHLRLHIPLSLGTPYAKSSGDFPVVWCTHVLSSSTSFPYGKIVTHFRWFVNGEF